MSFPDNNYNFEVLSSKSRFILVKRVVSDYGCKYYLFIECINLVDEFYPEGKRNSI